MNDSFIKECFTKLSAHHKISFFIMLQSCTYPRSKFFNSIKRSCNYFILFRTNDMRWLMSLSVSLYPFCKSFLVKAWKKACQVRFVYFSAKKSTTPKSYLDFQHSSHPHLVISLDTTKSQRFPCYTAILQPYPIFYENKLYLQ